jgi:hypothetical protein
MPLWSNVASLPGTMACTTTSELVTVPTGPDGVSPIFTGTLSNRAGRSGRKTISPAEILVP